MLTAEYAWESAERRCFEYLAGKLGTLEGVGHFMPEDYPRLMQSAAAVNEWRFEITGGPDNPHGVNSAWQMDGVFTGRFSSRSTALRTAGLVMEYTPAGSNWTATKGDDRAIVDVAEFSLSGRPEVKRDVADTDPDAEGATAAGSVVVWELTIPLMIVFGNIEKIT